MPKTELVFSPKSAWPWADGAHALSAAYRLALAQSLLSKFWWEQREEAAA